MVNLKDMEALSCDMGMANGEGEYCDRYDSHDCEAVYVIFLDADG